MCISHKGVRTLPPTSQKLTHHLTLQQGTAWSTASRSEPRSCVPRPCEIGSAGKWHYPARPQRWPIGPRLPFMPLAKGRTVAHGMADMNLCQHRLYSAYPEIRVASKGCFTEIDGNYSGTVSWGTSSNYGHPATMVHSRLRRLRDPSQGNWQSLPPSTPKVISPVVHKEMSNLITFLRPSPFARELKPRVSTNQPEKPDGNRETGCISHSLEKLWNTMRW